MALRWMVVVQLVVDIHQVVTIARTKAATRTKRKPMTTRTKIPQFGMSMDAFEIDAPWNC